MITIDIPRIELYDEDKSEFVIFAPMSITLEHSLVSISKWESKWHKPFLEKNHKTNEELRDYIRCMTLTQNVNFELYKYLPQSVLDQINNYIDDPMTATTFSKNSKKQSQKIVTSEVIYYWMIALQIPFECQKWHLNRLLTLIRVCNEKNDPKKMNRKDIYAQNRAINEARRKALKSKG